MLKRSPNAAKFLLDFVGEEEQKIKSTGTRPPCHKDLSRNDGINEKLFPAKAIIDCSMVHYSQRDRMEGESMAK